MMNHPPMADFQNLIVWQKAHKLSLATVDNIEGIKGNGLHGTFESHWEARRSQPTTSYFSRTYLWLTCEHSRIFIPSSMRWGGCWPVSRSAWPGMPTA